MGLSCCLHLHKISCYLVIVLVEFSCRHFLLLRDWHLVFVTLVQIALDQEKMKVQGGDLPGLFISTQIHFHWGKGSAMPGSEHAVDGKRYPMEVGKTHRRFTIIFNLNVKVLLHFFILSNLNYTATTILLLRSNCVDICVFLRF